MVGGVTISLVLQWELRYWMNNLVTLIITFLLFISVLGGNNNYYCSNYDVIILVIIMHIYTQELHKFCCYNIITIIIIITQKSNYKIGYIKFYYGVTTYLLYSININLVLDLISQCVHSTNEFLPVYHYLAVH